MSRIACKDCGEAERQQWKTICLDCQRKREKQYRIRQRLMYLERRRKALDRLGRRCFCCGKRKHMEFMQIDHVNGRKGLDKRLGDPYTVVRLVLTADETELKQYRAACADCNHAIGMYGYCPHNPDVKSTNIHAHLAIA